MKKNAILVKVLRTFRNPLTNRMAEVGQVMNVPLNIFWLKRLDAKDCEKAKNTKHVAKAGKKGSK